MQILLAMDIIGGQCVRLAQGDYQQKTVYALDPLDMAKRIEDQGFTRLHLVDLDGAKAGCVQNLAVLERVAAATRLQIDFSGGIRDRATVQRVLDAGATYVAVGSMAVKDPDEVEDWIVSWGYDRFMIGADVRDEQVVISGWLESSQLSVYELIDWAYSRGVDQVFCTDIAKDGMLAGTSNELYRRILQRFPDLQLIASGGVSSLEDLRGLREIGCSGAIVGKAIYEGRIRLEELAHL